MKLKIVLKYTQTGFILFGHCMKNISFIIFSTFAYKKSIFNLPGKCAADVQLSPQKQVEKLANDFPGTDGARQTGCWEV